MSTYRGMSVYHSVLKASSVLNVKALVGAFNQKKALVGAFSVIVKTGCGTDGALHSTILYSSVAPVWRIVSVSV